MFFVEAPVAVTASLHTQSVGVVHTQLAARAGAAPSREPPAVTSGIMASAARRVSGGLLGAGGGSRTAPANASNEATTATRSRLRYVAGGEAASDGMVL